MRKFSAFYDSKLSMRNKTVVSLEFIFWCTAAVPVASALKLSVYAEFKYNMYRVEKGNKKSVSKTYHSDKNMYTTLFPL